MSWSDTISVLPAAFKEAAVTYGGYGYDFAAPTMRSLTSTLDANWGCGGTDDSGRNWTTKYDSAASRAVTMGSAMVNALGKLHDLLDATSVSHANADAGSIHDPNPADQSRPGPCCPHFESPKFRGAYGGPSGAPFGWSLIAAWVQGHFWPNANDNKLDVVAAVWHSAADTMRTINTNIVGARAVVSDQLSPEVAQILPQIDLVTQGIDNAAQQFDTLGAACSAYAQVVVDAHRKILRELEQFLIVAASVEGVASVLGGFFGAGLGGVAIGGRGAAIGSRIAGFCTELAAEAALAAAPLAADAGIAGSGLLNDVQPLLDAQPTTFYANTRNPDGTPKYQGDRINTYQGTANAGFDGEQAAQNIRGKWAQTPSTIGNKRNVDVAQAVIDGQYYSPDELNAASGDTPAGAVQTPTDPMFTPKPKPGGVLARNTDGEYKLLEYLGSRLTPNSTGTIDLYSENMPCDSCRDVHQAIQPGLP